MAAAAGSYFAGFALGEAAAAGAASLEGEAAAEAATVDAVQWLKVSSLRWRSAGVKPSLSRPVVGHAGGAPAGGAGGRGEGRAGREGGNEC